MGIAVGVGVGGPGFYLGSNVGVLTCYTSLQRCKHKAENVKLW